MHSGYPTTIQEQSDSNVEEIDEEDEVSSEDEKTSLLRLPEPEPTEPPTPEGWSHTLRLWGWRIPVRLPRVIWVRTLKSSILVGKVSGTAFLPPILLRLNVCRSSTSSRCCPSRARVPEPPRSLSSRARRSRSRSWIRGSTGSVRRFCLGLVMLRCCPWRAGRARAASDDSWPVFFCPVLARTTEACISVYDGWRIWTCHR